MDHRGSKEPRRPTTFSCLRAHSELVHPVPVCVWWSHAELRTSDAPTNEGTVSLPGRSASQAENFSDQKPSILPQFNSSSTGEPTGAVPVSSASPSVSETGAAPADALLSDEFRKMFRRFLEEELGKAADQEKPPLEKEKTGKVLSDVRTVPVQTSSPSVSSAVATPPVSTVSPSQAAASVESLLSGQPPTNGDSS